MAAAEDHGGESHEAAAGGHAIGEDLQAAQRQLGPAERAEHAAEREGDEAHARRADADAPRREGMLAGGGELEAETGAAQEDPEPDDDEGHEHDEDREDAIGSDRRPEDGAEARQALRRGDRGLAAIDRLYGEVGAAEPEAGEAEAGNDRVGTQLLDDEPEQDRAEDAEHHGEAEAEEERAGLDQAEDRGAAADDHQSLEAEVPDAGALGEHAGERHVDQRRAVTEGGDDEFVHQVLPDARRRAARRASPGTVRAVMKRAMAALMMSMAAEGRPASTGR